MVYGIQTETPRSNIDIAFVVTPEGKKFPAPDYSTETYNKRVYVTSEQDLAKLQQALKTNQELTSKQIELHNKLQELHQTGQQPTVKKETEKSNMGWIAAVVAAGAAYLALR